MTELQNIRKQAGDQGCGRNENDVFDEVMIRWASSTAGILTLWGHISELTDDNEGEIVIFKPGLIDSFSHLGGGETN